MEIKRDFAGTDYESIEFQGKWDTIAFESKDSAGNVEVAIVENRNTVTFYFDQDNIKELIAFLQKQVKTPPTNRGLK